VPVAAPADKRFRRAQVKPSRRKRSWTGRALVVGRFVLALAFFGGGGVLLTRQVAQATSLHVDRIVIRGNERLQDGEVRALLEGLRGEHVLRVDLDRWRRRVETSPWVEQAALRRVLPSTIEVFIRERQPLAIGRRGGDLYLVDAAGRIIDDYGPNYAQFDLPIVDGLVPKPSRRGDPEVDEDRASLAARVVASLRRNDAVYRSVSQIDVSDPRNATVILEGDRALVLLGDDQFAERLESYVELKPALLAQVPEIEYVDLRFENRVYVRPAGSREKGAGR
jgi:cell division septal protein FtsQ